MRWKNQESFIMSERKIGVDTINLKVIRISIVSSKGKSRKTSKMEDRKNDVACTSTSHSNQECFQQKSGSKCKVSFIVVDGRNSKNMKPML